MNTYFETSALIKLVIDEEGSEDASAIWDGSDLVVTSRIAYPEARAALAVARRGRRLSSHQLAGARDALEDRFEELDLIEATESICSSAGDLAEQQGLRGYDAVHLASVLALGSSGIVLATWDGALGEAARTKGLAIAGATR